MRLIFICSYLNVPCVIDAVEREKGDFRILTDNQGLLKLFAEIYDKKNVIKLPQLFVSFGNIKELISDIGRSFKYKKKLLEVCKGLKPTKIIFFFLGWNGLSSWLIKKLSMSSEVFYQPRVNLEKVQSNYSLRLLLKTSVASCIYGIKYKSASYYGYPMITIDQSFLDLVNAREIEHSIDPQKVHQLVRAKYLDSQEIDVLLLTGGEYNIDDEVYQEKMHEVYEVFSSYFKSENICIKSHPNFPIIELSFADNCFVPAVETPANILCFASKCVIGYASASLYEAADLGLTAISLVNIIPSTEPDQAKRCISYLSDNSNSKNILFPRDLKEFDDILLKLA